MFSEIKLFLADLVSHISKRMPLILTILLITILINVINIFSRICFDMSNINAEIFGIVTTVILVDFFIENDRKKERTKTIYCSYVSLDQALLRLQDVLIKGFELKDKCDLGNKTILIEKLNSDVLIQSKVKVLDIEMEGLYYLLDAAPDVYNYLNVLITSFNSIWPTEILSSVLSITSELDAFSKKLMENENNDSILETIVKIDTSILYVKNEIEKAKTEWNMIRY